MEKSQQKESKNEEIEQNNIVYSINFETKTASVIRSPKADGDIIIPKSIKYKTFEYIVKSISKRAFIVSKIKSLQFPTDSELQTIENKAFMYSSIESISLPSSVTELKKGWCAKAFNLSEIIISPNNKRYCCLDEKYIIGKSSIEKEYYDELIFAVRNIEIATIPSFIECIKSFAFCECKLLKTINIPVNSELRIIENEAFSFSSIERLTLPAKLIDLRDLWCNVTESLTYVDVDPNNPRYAVYGENHKMIIGKSSIENDEYDVLNFCARDIEKVTIPSFIKHIASNAFHLCNCITNVEFPADSKLETIEKFAFANSSIPSLKVPHHLHTICQRAFIYCSQFQSIDIPMDSELKTIEAEAFYDCPIFYLNIPQKLVDLKEGWCESMENVIHINVSPDNPRYMAYDNDKLVIGKSSIDDEYDSIIFCNRDVKTIKIPSFIKYIGSNAFERCSLSSVEFETTTQLLTIGKDAFNGSLIDKFAIPSHVTTIYEYAFNFCQNLRKVEIPSDSKLILIDKFAFSESGIESFIIPPTVSQIGESAFSFCHNIQIIQIDENSILKFFHVNIFNNCHDGLFMIPAKLSINLIKN